MLCRQASNTQQASCRTSATDLYWTMPQPCFKPGSNLAWKPIHTCSQIQHFGCHSLIRICSTLGVMQRACLDGLQAGLASQDGLEGCRLWVAQHGLHHLQAALQRVAEPQVAVGSALVSVPRPFGVRRRQSICWAVRRSEILAVGHGSS